MNAARSLYRLAVPESLRRRIFTLRKSLSKPLRKASSTASLVKRAAINRDLVHSLCASGQFGEAARLLRQVPGFDKDLIHINYALGNIESAHRSYRRRKTSMLIVEAFDQPVSAMDLQIRTGKKRGSALVLAEGGPGDEIRFSALYDELAQHVEHLTVTCDPRLQTLLSRSFPEMDFVPIRRFRSEELAAADLSGRSKVHPSLKTFLNDEVFEAPYEIVFSTLDALGEFRRQRQDFDRAPQLVPDADRTAEIGARVHRNKGRLQIGLCWRSMRQDEARNRHYFSVSDLLPLASLDADFWLLQIAATDEELETLGRHLSLKIMDGLDLKDDFEGQAALMANMDFVISPLTNTAEMAGSLGVPTFIAAPDYTTSWRRNDDGSDIWYRSARTITSESVGGRHNIMQEIADKIAQTARSRAPRSITNRS